jgi:hypothetical protein
MHLCISVFLDLEKAMNSCPGIQEIGLAMMRRIPILLFRHVYAERNDTDLESIFLHCPCKPLRLAAHNKLVRLKNASMALDD